MDKVARWSKWGRRHWAWLFLGILVFLLLSFACFWLISTTRTSLNQNRRVTSERVTAEGVEIRVEYPQKLLVGETKPLHIDFVATTPITRPVTLTVTFPAAGTIRPAESTSNANGLQALAIFNPGKSVRQATVPIQNSGVWHAFRYEPTTMQVSTSLGHPFEPVSIEVEGVRHGAIRTTITGVVERNTPLLIGLAALAASIPLIIQFWEKRREEQLRQLTDLRSRLQQLQSEFRRCLREGSLRSAQAYFDEVKWLQEELILSSPLDGKTYDRLAQILRYANGEFVVDEAVRDKLLDEMNEPEYLAEVAGALILAAPSVRVASEEVRTDIDQLYLQFPAERLKDVAQRGVFLRAQREIVDYDLQTVWLDSDPAPASSSEDSIGPADRAEKEYGLLSCMGKRPNAFWPNHEIYSALLDPQQHTLLFGEAGCGRSAFAWHAMEHFTGQNRFAVLVPGALSFENIRHHVVKALLRFLDHRATRLLDMPHEAQRSLLAEVLVEAVGKDYALARLAEAQDKKLWVRDAQNEKQKKLWPIVGHTELELLQQTVEEWDAPPSSREPASWLRDFDLVVRSLGFRSTCLILDADPDASSPLKLSPADLRRWEVLGIFVTLCLRSDAYYPIQKWLNWVPAQELTWSAEQFDQLLLWRCGLPLPGESSDRRTADINHYFDDPDGRGKAFAAFRDIEPATPRQLGRLWRTLRNEYPVVTAYSEDQVRTAKAKLES